MQRLGLLRTGRMMLGTSISSKIAPHSPPLGYCCKSAVSRAAHFLCQASGLVLIWPHQLQDPITRLLNVILRAISALAAGHDLFISICHTLATPDFFSCLMALASRVKPSKIRTRGRQREPFSNLPQLVGNVCEAHQFPKASLRYFSGVDCTYTAAEYKHPHPGCAASPARCLQALFPCRVIVCDLFLSFISFNVVAYPGLGMASISFWAFGGGKGCDKRYTAKQRANRTHSWDRKVS